MGFGEPQSGIGKKGVKLLRTKEYDILKIVIEDSANSIVSPRTQDQYIYDNSTFQSDPFILITKPNKIKLIANLLVEGSAININQQQILFEGGYNDASPKFNVIKNVPSSVECRDTINSDTYSVVDNRDIQDNPDRTQYYLNFGYNFGGGTVNCPYFKFRGDITVILEKDSYTIRNVVRSFNFSIKKIN